MKSKITPKQYRKQILKLTRLLLKDLGMKSPKQLANIKQELQYCEMVMYNKMKLITAFQEFKFKQDRSRMSNIINLVSKKK